MTEQATQLDPEIMIPALVTSTKSTASVQSSSPITVDGLEDWTQESTVGPKKLLCTPEYDSSYQTQGYTTNENKNFETPNNRKHRQSSGSDPLSPTKPGVSRELNFTATFPGPIHQSTPLRENNGKGSSNRKNGRKSKKNKRANRRPSEVVAKNQAENSSEEETEEYEVFIAVPEKRTAELIGKQGSHLKKYYKEFEVDITIVPGPEFSEKFESNPPLKRVNSVVVQNVFRFESYYQENIKTVLQDMQQKFWKADTILTQIAMVSTINEDFFNDYWHDRNYYAKSHFLQPKPNQRSSHNSERANNNNNKGGGGGSYNFHHSIPDSTEKWESLVQEQEETEEDRLRQMAMGQTSFDQAMGIPMENDCPDARSWRMNNGNNKTKKKNQRNQKKARTQKAKWRGKDGLCCPCTHLSVDKRSEARIFISHTNPDSNTLYIQQPTHPSYSTLAYLENNLFHCYDPKGEAFNADKVPSVVDREEARTCEHYVTVADPYQPEAKYVRGKIEGYSDDDDVCTIFFCDYGGSLTYHRTDVYKLAREFCQLPFQACLVEVEPCFENDFGTQNSNISNSAGEATQTTSGTDEELEQELARIEVARMRSSTVLGETSEVTDVELPILSKVGCVSPSKTAESVCSNVKTKRNQFQKQILDSENVQFETYTDVTQFASIYELFCEVVMEIEDIDREESIPHIRIYRYDFSKGVKQKCYIDYIPHLAPVLNSPVMSPEPVMSPVPTEDEVSFLPSDLDVSQQLASFITSDPSHLALFESLVQQNLQNLQLSTQSFAEIAREQAQFDTQEAFSLQNQNFNPEAQAFVPRT